MYRLTDEQLQHVQQAASLADQFIAPHAAKIDSDHEFPRESLAALGRAGFLGLTVPSAFGGSGQGLRTAAAVLEQIAQRCSSTAMIYLMHVCGVGCYAVAPDKTASFLQAAARGDHLTTLAFSEPGTRSHFWAPVSRAAAADDGAVHVTAHKSFVTAAGHADGYVVSTLGVGATKITESTIYLVLRSDGGVRVTGPWHGLGMRGNASAPMTFEHVTLDAGRALTASGKGLDLMLGVVLPTFQVGSAAVALGIAEAAVQATTRHLTSTRFEHLHNSLAELPTLRSRLAQIRLETDRARAHLVSVLDAIERPGPTTQLLVLEAKAAATEAAAHVTDLALRTCGGAAFGGALGLERLFRDARAPIVMAPTSDQAYDFIGRALCGLEVF
jgi:alkylation response protein AidB-like acyl-CoA dehydrogenase